MFGSLLRFELRGHLRRPTTWLYFAILLLLAFGVTSSDVIQTGGSLGKVKKNSPFALAQSYAILITIGQVITSALVGTAVLRDFDQRVHELLFTTRITRNGYLAAKFLAALSAMLVVYAALPLGSLIGTVMPWVDKDTLGPIALWYYVQPFLVIGVPTVFFVSALFFATGALTRNQFTIYVMGILLLVGISLGDQLIRTLDNDRLANLIDPFGFNSMKLATRYWTIAEKNSRVLPLEGFLLVNRLAWFGVSCALMVVAFFTVRLEKDQGLGWWRRRARHAQQREAPAPKAPSFVTPAVTRRFGARDTITMWWSVTRFHGRSLLRSIPFLAIAAIGLVNVVMSCVFADQNGDTKTWALSFIMSETAAGASALFVIVLLTFYAGELVWRERQVELAQVLDASPVRTIAVQLGKFTALLVLLAVFQLTAILGGIIVQLAKGVTAIDLGQYFTQLFVVNFPTWVLFAAIAFLVQSLVPRKAIGHVVMIVIYVVSLVYANIGWEHRLYQILSGVSLTYSDMNGYGPYPNSWWPVHGYWLSIAMLFVVATYLTWVRGTETANRLQMAAQRFTRRAKVVAAGSALSAGAFGAFVFYNTNVLNRYEGRKAAFTRQAGYERTYRQFLKVNQPKVVAVSMTVDVFPSELRVSAAGTLTLLNRHTVPIDSIYVDGPGLEDGRITWDTLTLDRAATAIIADTVRGITVFRLATPLSSGDSLHLRYRLRGEERGFRNGDYDHAISANGTFLNRETFPSIGYSVDGEIAQDAERKKQKLPERARAYAIGDTAHWQEQVFAVGSDFIRFDATVSTDSDQIAIAPGYLKREWREGARRYFTYAMDAPIPDFYSVLSARWVVQKDRWNDVAIEVYHDPAHQYNVARMIEASKAALSYFTREFGAYQHRQVRILEFPRYAGFAQSFPNTIPYSEAIGFIVKVDSTSENDTDLPWFVTSHEIAHQWFPYQRMPANVQGAEAVSEALSEYAALAVLEEKYGPERTQKFLRTELNGYLRGRSAEQKKEMPLLLVESQPYIHYQKGSLAFFALRDLIGASALNGALRKYLDEGRFTGPPYATTNDLLRQLKAATPDSLQYAIHDLFETITLWDFKADSAESTKLPDGTWKVRLVASSTKLRADSTGVETQIPIADYVDVGVFGKKAPGARLGKRLAVRKVKLTQEHNVFEFIVHEKPERAGIDPYNRLIDRNPGDNSRDITSK